MIQVFFNQPGKPDATKAAHSILLDDLKWCREQLTVAAAWFTDVTIANAIANTKVDTRIVLNAGDLMREKSTKAYKILYKRRFDNDYPAPPFGFAIAGNKSWKEGIMHNKIIACDGVVWTGSYNFTVQAENNFENLLRIDDPEIANLYHSEIRGYWDKYQNDKKYFRWVGSADFDAANLPSYQCEECCNMFLAGQLKYYNNFMSESRSRPGSFLCKKCIDRLEEEYDLGPSRNVNSGNYDILYAERDLKNE